VRYNDRLFVLSTYAPLCPRAKETLTLFVLVRIQVPQPSWMPRQIFATVAF